MLANSFEDQGSVFFLAWEKIAGPPTWMDSELAPWGLRRPSLSPSKCVVQSSGHKEYSLSIIDQLGTSQPNEQSREDYK